MNYLTYDTIYLPLNQTYCAYINSNNQVFTFKTDTNMIKSLIHSLAYGLPPEIGILISILIGTSFLALLLYKGKEHFYTYQTQPRNRTQRRQDNKNIFI